MKYTIFILYELFTKKVFNFYEIWNKFNIKNRKMHSFMSSFSLLYLSKINNRLKWTFHQWYHMAFCKISSVMGAIPIRKNLQLLPLSPEVTKELSNDHNQTNLEFDWIKLSEKFNLIFQNILHLCKIDC